MAARLRESAERAQSGLFFPVGGDDVDESSDRLLTIFNLKGITYPQDGVPEEKWRWEERLSRPLLNLAAWLAQRATYHGDLNRRKGICLDEAHELRQVASGRTLLTKCARDSRKHNASVLVVTQNAQDVLGADIGNFVGSVFAGKTTDREAQDAALRLLGLPGDAGYQKMLAGLSPRPRNAEGHLGFREFIFRDGMGGEDGRGGIERIRIDLGNHPHVHDALRTTADPLLVRVHRDAEKAPDVPSHAVDEPLRSHNGSAVRTDVPA